tara:strand:+ start:942 stop:1595 length:654 start_codon:yes stop_codon:yes gene_type:complete
MSNKPSRERLLQIIADHLGYDQLFDAARITSTLSKANKLLLTEVGVPIASTKSRGDYIEIKVWEDSYDYLINQHKRSRPKCSKHINVTPYGEIIVGRGRGRKRSNINPRHVYCRLDSKWYQAARMMKHKSRHISCNQIYKEAIIEVICRHLVRQHLGQLVICMPTSDNRWAIIHPDHTPVFTWNAENETEAWTRAYKESVPTTYEWMMGIKKELNRA